MEGGQSNDADEASAESALAVCSAASRYRAATPTCGGLSDAYTKAAVNVGWVPYRTIRATSIMQSEGHVLGTLAAGKTFNLQTTRNPTCIDSPPLRPPLSHGGHAYRWGYAGQGALTGWVRDEDLVYDGDDCKRTCQDGPASADFQVSRNPDFGCEPTCCRETKTRKRGGCWSRAVNSQYDGDHDCGGSRTDVLRWVNVVDSHLRYAPLSTSKRWTFRCDRVRQLYHAHGWAFVELTRTTQPGFNPTGQRGWLLESSLSVGKPAGCD